MFSCMVLRAQQFALANVRGCAWHYSVTRLHVSARRLAGIRRTEHGHMLFVEVAARDGEGEKDPDQHVGGTTSVSPE